MQPDFSHLTGTAISQLSVGMSSSTPTSTIGVGTCSHPITLRRTVTDSRTGSSNSTEHAKRCGTRIKSRCPSCSALYKGDAFRIIRSGIIDATTNLPKLVTMVTLTAPGSDKFGKTHVRHLTKNNKVQRCSCRRYHNENDRLLGTPIDPDTYNYVGAAAFNANASRLIAVTMQKLGRLLGRKLRVIRVIEFQTRGLVHVHALVLGPVPQCSLELVVRGGKNLRTGRPISAAMSGGWKWGEQCDAKVIQGETPGRAIAYLVKVVMYALKDTGHGECRNFNHGERMAAAASAGVSCELSLYECKHGSSQVIVERNIIDVSTGEISTIKVPVSYQGKRTSRICRRHRRAENGWGFRGHILAKSRNWGCTFGEVRARRNNYVAASKPSLPSYLTVTWERLREPSLTGSTSGVSPP